MENQHPARKTVAALAAMILAVAGFQLLLAMPTATATGRSVTVA